MCSSVRQASSAGKQDSDGLGYLRYISASVCRHAENIN